MPGPASALQTAPNLSMSDPTALQARAVLPWRALVVAALLSVVLGTALYEGLAGERSSVAPPVRPGGFSHKGLASLPLSLQGAVSGALGADNRAYRVSASDGGFAAASPAQRLSLRFGRSGVSLSSGAAQVALSLRAVGYGTSLTAVGRVTPSVHANRVSYARAGLSEWYVNGPLGLEQGFTIPRAPSGHPAGPLTLSLALSGNVYASLGSGGQSITLSRAGATALRYGQLSALDATGRRLPAHMQIRNGTLQLRIDDSHARYPLRIDPFFQQGSKLTGSGEIGGGDFGSSVALSGDGNTALIGSPGDNGGVGAAWVFTRSGSTWTQQGGKLTGSGESGGGQFGYSVALSSDGNTALIGGPRDNGEVGAAWVFTRSGSIWTQQGKKLTGSGEIGAGRFGWSVSVDGNTALIGGRLDNGSVGAAWVFTRSGTTWTQQGSKLTGSGESGGGEFGWSVALSGDGNTALIGGFFDNGAIGAAWVFTRSGSTWTQQGSKLTGGEEIGQVEFGSRVALSSDGNTALIGGRLDNGNVGAAWVFTRSGSTWTQQGSKLTGGEEIGRGFFGESVALSADGNTALIGGSEDNGSIGAAWVFTRSGSTWTQQGGKLTGSGESGNGHFGASVALSGDGNTALIGSADDAAWVFTRSGSTWTQQGSKLTASPEVGAAFGFSVALSADGNTALIGDRSDNTNVGAAWVFTRSGSTWTQQGSKLTGSGESGVSEFGFSVALSADGNTALIGGERDNSLTGAAWVFTRSGSTWTQQGSKLTGSGESGTEGVFGWSVALSADGNTALIGGPGDNPRFGAAWVFTRSGETWTQQGSKLTGGGVGLSESEFGFSVALSADGNTALIGGRNTISEGRTIGSAWVFTRSGSTWTQQGEAFTGSGSLKEIEGHEFGFSVALSADGNTALIGGPRDKSGENVGVGAAWVFTRSGSTWTQQGPKLTGSGEIGNGFFGSSVALSGDGNTALIGGPIDKSDVGAAWVFTRSGSTWTQQGSKLTGSGESGFAEFGYSVALSSDGNTALIGGRNDYPAGAAWVFFRAEAEYGRCVKVAKGAGKYASATCISLKAGGSYEWLPGVEKKKFTTKITEGAATLETVKGSKVVCKTETSTGEYTGTKTVGGVVLILTGCERLGEKCSSAGAAGGEIVTKSLEGVLGIEKLGVTNATNKIAFDLFPVGKTGMVMEFSCGGTEVSVQGSLIVPVSANKMLLTSTLKYSASKGKQKPEMFVGEPKDILEASFNKEVFAQTGLTLKTTQTNEEPVEVNSVA
jgi:FG-GAP repeat